MVFTTENILLVGSLFLFAAILAGKTSQRFGIPTLVLFLAIGMLAGSDGIGGIYFNDPNIAQFLGILALIFILFSGGLDTQWKIVRSSLWPGITLSTAGVFITTFSVGAFVYWVTDFTFTEGLLLGAIVSSTDAAAVFSILRGQRLKLKGNLQGMLEFESGSNDPMAYFLTITFISLIQSPEDFSIGFTIAEFFMEMAIGGVAGILLGKGGSWLINNIRLNAAGLYPVMLMGLAVFAFAITEKIHGNGFLSVYLCGLMLGNTNFIHKKSLQKHFDSHAWIMQIIMFLTLGLLVFPSDMWPLAGTGMLIAVFLVFVARPVAVWLCLPFFRNSPREIFFVSWVGLRGAVPIVFATYPLIERLPQAETIFNLVFFITLTSVLLQGTSLPIIGKWLGVIAKPDATVVKSPEFIEDSGWILGQAKLSRVSPWIGKKIVEVELPPELLIAMIKRNGMYFTPKGSTKLLETDRLYIIADTQENLEKTRKLLEEG